MEQEKQVNTGFTRQEIENHLHSALAAATPDLWPELERALKAGILTVPDASGREGFADFLPAPGDESISLRRNGRKQVKKFSWIRRFGAAAAVFACLLGGGWYHYEYLQIASQIEIDVNPSLKLSLNRRERVIKVQAQNDDGERLAEGIGLKGKTVQAAVDQVVDSLIERGYLEKGQQEHAVLVSVSGKTPELAEQVKAAVTIDMESALARKEVKAVVYDQVIQVTDELEELAQTYQVSLGKAEFIGQLVQENVSLSENRQDAYSRMMNQTMEELSGEIDRNSYQVGAGVSVVKTEQAVSRIRETDRDNSGSSGLLVSGEDGKERTEDRERERDNGRQEESPAEKREEGDWLKNREPEEFPGRPVPERPKKNGEDRKNMEKDGGKPEGLDLRQEKDGQEEPEKTDGSELEEKGSGSEAIRRRPQPRDEAEESEESTVQDESGEPEESPAQDEAEEPEGSPAQDESGKPEGSPAQDEAEESEGSPAQDESGKPEGSPAQDEAEESEGSPAQDEAEESEGKPGRDKMEEPGKPSVREQLDEEEVPEGELPSEREGGPDVNLDGEEQEPEETKEPGTSGENTDTETLEEKEIAEEKPEEALGQEERAEEGTGEEPKEFETAGEESGEALEQGEAPAEVADEEQEKPETAKEGAGGKPKEAETGSLEEPGPAGKIPGRKAEEPEVSEEKTEPEEINKPESAAPSQREITEPGHLKPEGEEGAGRVIRTGTKIDTFEPGDMAGEREDGQTITSSGTKIIFEAVEKKTWEEPVYASQYLTGSERSLLQMGPGVFFGRVSLENQEGLLQLGPGFAYLYDNPLANWDESYLWGVRIVPCKGKVYQTGQAGKDEIKK